MTSDEQPPRVLGSLLALLGVALAVGGISLMQQGDSPYFLVAGLGILASGVLIAMGKMVGAWAFLATFVLMVAWSLAEVGANIDHLLPRILLPGLFCAYIFSARVRPRLR